LDTQIGNWLGHPAVQGGVLPFMVSLIVASVLARTRFVAWSQVAGVLACATLAVGWSFEALTSTRKLMLIVATTAVLVAAIEISRRYARAVTAMSVAFVALAAVWMLWRLLAQKDTPALVLSAALALAYVAALVGATLRVSRDPVQGAVSGAAIGFATGVAAVLGASAVLGMLGIAAGVSAAATLVAWLALGDRAAPLRTIAFPATAGAALVGAAAVSTAQLRALCLVPLLFVPPLVRAAASRAPAGTWRGAIAAALAALVPACGTALLAWFHTA
jgi:hypothetical protein